MIYEFTSRATGSIILTEPVGNTLLEAIGREPGKSGVITVDQMPDVIAKLEALSAANPTEPLDEQTKRGVFDSRADIPVSLSQRAFPLIEMLQEALKAGKEVTWTV
ncbi:MAG: DUF1840 domain-containing protein [Burkholderiaceae bacterium]